jgi:hypothetical protein
MSSSSFANESPSIGVPDCDVIFTQDGEIVDIRDERGHYCGRTRENEAFLLKLDASEARCSKLLDIELALLAISDELYYDCSLDLELAKETVYLQEDHTEKMKKMAKMDKIKIGLIAGGAGFIIGAILVVVAAFAI